MGSIIRELRYTVRSLLRSPAFTAVAVMTLAIGIGGNTAVFSVISAVIMSPLPYDAPDELVVVGGQLSGIGSQDLTASPAEFRDYGERSRTLERVAASWILNVNVTGVDQPFRGQTAVVTPNFLPLLGVEPMLGRGLTQEDTGGDIGHVSILSYAAWQRFYGGDSTVVGRVILIDDDPIEIVGVMPEGFEHPGDLQGGSVDMWAPIDLSVDSRFGQGRNNRPYTLYGRLQGGTDIRAAKAEFLAISADLREEYPEAYPIEAGWSAQVVPLLDRVVGSAQSSLWVIFGAVGFVLLVACTNVANLLLARGSTRSREIAIRSALGGARTVIGRRFVLESLVLGVVGGGVGLLLAYAGTGIIRNGAAAFVPRVEGAHMSVSVLLFTLVAALATSLIFGLIPAVQLSRINLQDLLKDGAGGSGVARGAHRLRNGLVVAEVAMAIVLLVGSGLLLKSFNRLMDVEPGFDAEPVMTLRTYLPWTITPQDGRYFDLPVRVQFFGEAIRRIAELPGVERAAVTSNLPLRRLNGASFVIEGSEQEGTNRAINAEVRRVSPSYFEAMSIPLIRGRVLAPSDEVDTPPVVVVNQAWVARYSPDEVAVGRRIRIGNNPQAPWNEIVGVVGNVSQHGLDIRPRETMYASYRQGVSIDMTFVIKTAGVPERVTAQAIAAIHSLDPTLPVFLPETMNDVVAGTVAERRLVMVLLLLFAAQATVLAAIGIYGVISQSVTQRLREIGIRLALGAERPTVMGLVFRDGMRLALVGVLIGAGIAALASQVLTSMLFGVGRLDLVVFGSVAAMALAVAALATLIPALRATGVDPLLTMKAD